MINTKSTASDNLKTIKGGHSNSNKNVGKLEPGRKEKRPKLKKRKRLIIRNLSFKVNEEDLKEIFSKFGKVLDVKIPLKEDGKKRGFAFIEFEETKSLIQAMKTMNYKEIQGRKVAIDYAVDKTSYKLKLQGKGEEKQNSSVVKKEIKDESESDSEIEIKSEKNSDEDETDQVKEHESEEDEDEKRLNAFLKEFDSGAEALTKPHIEDDKSSSSESSSDEESDADEEVEENNIKKEKVVNKKNKIVDGKEKAVIKKERSNDVNDGKTVFLRNVSFQTTEESLEEEVANYGEYEYCVLVRDQLTDHPKGSAFVKFKSKESAEKLIEQSEIEPGVVVDGRRLSCVIAVSKEAIPTGKPLEKKDKRNLNLLRVGIILPEEADGMSKTDMAKRTQLEMIKKAKLRNVNFFVSDKRLLVHNLPQTYTDGKLRQLFKKAAGSGAVITEARVMKEFKKVNSEGVPLSKGFGFVSFEKHEDAMKALSALNNNPSIFTAQRRPIVEFSIENKVALLSKERRKEKVQMRNKRRTEEKNERKLKQAGEDKADTKSPQKGKKRKNKKKQLTEDKRKKNKVNEIEKQDSPVKGPKKKKQKKTHSKSEKKKMAGMSDLKKKYTDIMSNQVLH